jgi:membrane protein
VETLFSPRPAGLARRFTRDLRPTLRYLMETEVHVYAFSIAANVLLSFFPFLIVIVTLSQSVFRWPSAADAILVGLKDYFPDSLGEFIQYNVKVMVQSRGPFQVASIVMLLFTANGIFEPLEVALNRAWGVTKNRNYFHNQLVSLGLIFVCGALALASTLLTALNRDFWSTMLPAGQSLPVSANLLFFKLAALPMMIVVIFLVYWLLPNRKIPPVHVIPVAICVGLVLEVLKYVNLITWPYLRRKLFLEVGPFYYSASIILWSTIAAMVVLAGAEWSARWARESACEQDAAN